MTNPIQNEVEVQELKLKEPLGSAEDTETNGETRLPITDHDTMLSMIVLLLACLALAAMANVFVQ